MHFRIIETIADTDQGMMLMMHAGPFTGVYGHVPVSAEDRAGMREAVANLAMSYMGLPDDADLVSGEDMTLAEIKAGISQYIVKPGDQIKAEDEG